MSGVLEGAVAKATVGKLVNKAFEPLEKVVEYTLCYRSKVASVQEKIVCLEIKLTDVEGFIKDAARNGNQILQEPTNWVTLTQTALQDALSLKERSAHDTCCWPFSIGDCNCKRRYKMADEAVKLTEDIEELMTTARAFNVATVSKMARPERLSAMFAHPYKSLPSMDVYIETLKGALVGGEKREIIGVYGLKGAGKTLLVKKLAVMLDEESQDEEVNHVVYVSAQIEGSDKTKYYHYIQDAIAERVGLQLKLNTVEERAMWLAARLTEIGNVVFIIDHVEANDDFKFNECGIPWSHDNKNGCRFVMVSRSLNICKQMGTQMEIEVEHLAIEDSLNLFKESVRSIHGEESSNAYQRDIDHISSGSTWLAGEVMEYFNQRHSQIDLNPEGIELLSVKLEGSTPLKVQNELWDALSRGESRVGVWGMGGAGKSSIAMHFNNEIMSGRHDFKHVFYVTVSQGCSVYKLQESISKTLDHHSLRNEDETSRAAELHMSLKNRKETLLILDDMWEDIPMQKVGVGGNDCKLLITTRKRDVCRKMNCSTIVEIRPLAKTEAWDLFVSQLGDYESLSDEAKGVAKSIAEECAGLPLAIITMAGCMRGERDEYVWRDILRQLQSASTEQKAMEDRVFSILKYSYERLSRAKLQECFLYCALYPEDARIVRSELIYRFIAMDYINESSWEENMDKGHSLLNELEAASLLECVTDDEGKRCVKMHDLVRDMAIKIIGCKGIVKARKGLKEIPRKEEWTQDLVHVSLMDNEIRYIGEEICPGCPNLSVLILGDNYLESISESLFVHMASLSILDLSNNQLISELPDSISNLFNLTSLVLNRCRQLIAIPSLARLTKLRELDLNCCLELRKWPEGFNELMDLKHLDMRCTRLQSKPDGLVYNLNNLECLLLDRYSNLAILPEELKSLKKLQRLNGRVDDLYACNELVDQGSFNKLKAYNLGVGRTDLSYSRGQGFVKNVDDCRVLAIFNCELRTGTDVLLKVPHSAQTLELLNCRFGIKCLVDALPSLIGATQLRVLTLHCCSGIEYLISDASFMQGGNEVSKPLNGLCELRFWSVDDLVSFQGGMGPPYICFDTLTKLDLEDCPKLNNIFIHTDNLPNMKSVKLRKCGFVEEVFPTMTEAKCLPKLQELAISDMSGLKSICKNGVIFPKLQDLCVTNCPKLKSTGLLNHDMAYLHTIVIRDCTEMEEIFIDTDRGDDVVQLPSLQKLHLRELPELRSISNKALACNSLDEICVERKSNCMKLEYFPISVPRLLQNENPPPPYPKVHLSAYGENEHNDWWNSLTWIDPLTQNIFNKLGCFEIAQPFHSMATYKKLRRGNFYKKMQAHRTNSIH